MVHGGLICHNINYCLVLLALTPFVRATFSVYCFRIGSLPMGSSIHWQHRLRAL